MIAIADDRFSIVTVFDAATDAVSQVPTWKSMLGLPAGAHCDVPLAVRSTADRKIWAARLDDAIRGADRAVLLVADGLGCAASAWWARLSPSQDVSRVAGALLFASTAQQHPLFASPATSLPFPSLVIHSAQADVDLRSTMRQWGSRGVVGERVRGGDTTAWGHAQRLFLRLTSHVVEHEVGRVTALAPRRQPPFSDR